MNGAYRTSGQPVDTSAPRPATPRYEVRDNQSAIVAAVVREQHRRKLDYFNDCC